MADLLSDYELKRGRAMFHLDRLRKSIEHAPNRGTEPIRGEPNADGTQYRFQVPMPKIDPDWVVMIGDFCFNRRASLDYLITALVRIRGQVEDESNQFPIYYPKRVSDWDKVEPRWDNDPGGTLARYLNNTPTRTKAMLKPLQPFYGVPMTNPWRHPLFILQSLNNRDKHRRLNLLARNATVDFTDAQGKPIFDVPAPDARIVGPQEHDTYTVTLTGEFDVDVYLIATHDIRFHEGQETWALFAQVLETLDGINQFIDGQVLTAIRTLL